MNCKQIWAKVQQALKHNIFLGNNAYIFYIRVLKPVTIQDNKLIIEGPNLFTINIVEKKYGDIILKEIQSIQPSLGLQFISSVDRDKYTDEPEEDHLEPIPEDRSRINLDPKYTFDNFITGECNKFAQATAWAITKNPGKSFNPFFIYGKSGIGKTHLMHAMCHEILDHNPNLRVKYVSSEQFTNELIDSIKTDKNQVFRDRYRSLDVLMIDDIQFLQNKPGIQEEFFHTFNSLHSNDSQIVIASDKLPKEIQSLQERLVNRFESGVVADMAMPDLETRIAILEKKAAFEKYDIPETAIYTIAESVTSNIRELLAAMVRSRALVKVKDMSYDMAIPMVLREMMMNSKKVITPEEIIQKVALEFSLHPDDITGPERKKEISLARHVAMYITRHLTDLSFPNIAAAFGNRHHSTVLSACDKIKESTSQDPALNKLVRRLIREIKK